MKDHGNRRSRSLEHQIELYASRLRLLKRGTLWLTPAILVFILTVACTSIVDIFPDAHVCAWITVASVLPGRFWWRGSSC